MAIADLVASPLAEGLFARAIIQSGHGAMVREIDVAQRLVKKLAKILRITPDVAGFRSVSDTAAMDAIAPVAKPWSVDLRDKNGREPASGNSRFIPVYGAGVPPAKARRSAVQGTGGSVRVSAVGRRISKKKH